MDDEALAAGERPGPIEDLRPQGAIHGHSEGHIEQPSLDIPGMQMTEEATSPVPAWVEEQGIVLDHEL